MKKTSGRLVSALSAAALSVTALGAFSAVLPAQAAGLSGLDAKGITSQMVIGWNLGNTLDSSGTKLPSDAAPQKFATAWGNPVPSEELIQTVKDGGFNTIRIPTTWYEHLEWDEGSQMYLINDEWMDFVKQTVDYAYDRDMFVILNVHHEDWVNVGEFTDATFQTASKKLTDIWSQVSEEFKDYDQHLIFEGMNEPRQTGLGGSVEWGAGDANSWSYINRLNAQFVDTVRGQGSAANKERLLMLPGYCASSTPETIRAIEVPANAGNVALSVHAYSPYFFTMATDEYANHSFPGASGYGEDYEGALSNMFNEFSAIMNEKNCPIIIGEFSASDFDNTEDRARWATSYLSKAKQAGIPCVLWDNNAVSDGTPSGEAHGYIYRATNTWYPNSAPVIQAMMQVYGITPDLKPYEELKFDWSKVTIGDDWIKLYREDNGKEVKTWKNFTVSGWQDYVNENYDFVMIYESSSDPELVLQGSGTDNWNRIQSGSISENPFMRYFSYEDVMQALGGKPLSDMQNFYISASNSDMTAYALYAAPKGSVVEPTETVEPTEATTEAVVPTETEEATDVPVVTETESTPVEGETILGDADGNNTVEVADIVMLQKYLLGMDVPIKAGAELNGDGVVDIFDLALLKHMLVH